MKKYIIGGIAVIIYSAILYGVGRYHGVASLEMGYKKMPETKIEIVEESKVEAEPVTREYRKLSRLEFSTLLKRYDEGDPWLNGKMITSNKFKATAGLADRSWSRTFTLETKHKVGSSGNWNFYVKAGIITVIAGLAGYGGYRLYKEFRD